MYKVSSSLVNVSKTSGVINVQGLFCHLLSPPPPPALKCSLRSRGSSSNEQLFLRLQTRLTYSYQCFFSVFFFLCFHLPWLFLSLSNLRIYTLGGKKEKTYTFRSDHFFFHVVLAGYIRNIE